MVHVARRLEIGDWRREKEKRRKENLIRQPVDENLRMNYVN